MQKFRYFSNKITHVKDNEVFVFGSNLSGFHGAGAAGFALRGTSQNTWRTDSWFLQAMKSNIPEDKIGMYAVYGVSKGFMTGRYGSSYAIQTIVRPGLKRSISLTEIEQQVKEFLLFAQANPKLTFYVTAIGCDLAGYYAHEIAPMFKQALYIKNVVLTSEFEPHLKFFDKYEC